MNPHDCPGPDGNAYREYRPHDPQADDPLTQRGAPLTDNRPERFRIRDAKVLAARRRYEVTCREAALREDADYLDTLHGRRSMREAYEEDARRVFDAECSVAQSVCDATEK